MASQDQHGTLIVTGASRGIGAAIAKLAGERGFFVAVNFVNGRGEAAAVVHEIASAGERARAIQGDVANEEDVVRLFETAERELGPIKALVNNAAITGGFARVESVSATALAQVMAVNITGAFLCAPQRPARQESGYTTPLRRVQSIASRSAWRVRLPPKESA